VKYILVNDFKVDSISVENDVTVSLSHAEDRVYAGNTINGRIVYPTFVYLVRFLLYFLFFNVFLKYY
jgi:hypothetical protein